MQISEELSGTARLRSQAGTLNGRLDFGLEKYKLKSDHRHNILVVFEICIVRSAQWSRYANYPFLRQHDAGWEIYLR